MCLQALTLGTFKFAATALMRLFSFMYSFHVKVRILFVDTKEVTNFAVKYGGRFLNLYVYFLQGSEGPIFQQL